MARFTDFGKDLLGPMIRKDAEVDFRIEHGIEMYRKGFGRIMLNDADGKPVRGATIRLHQKKHEFLFGCNAFLYDQFPEKSKNKIYAEKFAGLFNEAVIPFYWRDFEKQEGVLRYKKNSEKVYRRPAVEPLLDFCEKHSLVTKGHPLCWHQWMPDWAPKTEEELMRRLDRRLREIAELCGKRIFMWDCVNEAQTRYPLRRDTYPAYPDDYVEKAFRMAYSHFPMAKLIYNDDCNWWNFQGDYSPVYLLVRTLMEHGVTPGGVGFQFHMFDYLLHGIHKDFFDPRKIMTCFDLYGKLGLPLNISEISITSRKDLGDGDAFQAIAAERLYKLWFSHPAIEGITWWNLVDGTAAGGGLGTDEGENKIRAGLLNYDLSEKKAWKVLEHLIRKEWHTETKLEYKDGEMNLFHGFYGLYDAEIRTDSGTFRQELYLSKHGEKTFVLKLKQ